MKFTNVRELKSKTSEMLRIVEQGNTVLVTTHGRPTAMLVPVTEDDIEDALLAYSPKLRKKNEEPRSKLRGITELKQSDLSQIFAGLPLPLHVPFDSLPVGPLSHRRDIVPIAPKFSAP